jgi:hypothetical protein
MGIIKSLRPHTVSWNEAVAFHLKQAPPDELAKLRTSRGRVDIFAIKFANVGALKSVFSLGQRPYNDYEKAVEAMAPEVQALGRAACVRDCETCVWFRHAGGEIATSESTLRAECVKPGCPETGLEAIETHFEGVEDTALAAIEEFNNTSPAEFRAQA